MDCNCSEHNLTMDDNSHLRRIIIKIQARLSDDDRKYLHFFLGDDIPRRIRDDPTLGGTLCAMESLFDRDIISGDDFTYLITAFEAIGCLDAVTILKGHQQQMKLTHVHQSMLSLISIMPPLPPSAAEVFADQDDEEAQPLHSDKHKRFSTSFRLKIYVVIIVLLVLCTTGILITVPFMKGIQTNKLNEDTKMKDVILKEQELKNKSRRGGYIEFFSENTLVKVGNKHGSTQGTYSNNSLNPSFTNSHYLNGIRVRDNNDKEQKKRNETIQLFDESILEKNQQANDQLALLNKKKFIEGREFGSAYGTHFDDSTHPYFTSLHYLNGILAHDNNDSIESYQFYYSPSSDGQDTIISERHGKQTLSFKKDFQFDKNEKIQSVEGHYLNKTIVFSNGTILTMRIITGLRFYTTKGYASPSYAGEEGEMFEEEYENYTLWYVTGRSDEYIHQLQFYWYRTLDID
ncbi:unnamed protein product [Adineta steineri]|uniref:Uncharacterized protein n=1 Tax=Adineta steineri TaxID=433720 RepID=A0A814RWN7_9BILA|nr:unnamed protein product [Adineta steineri]